MLLAEKHKNVIKQRRKREKEQRAQSILEAAKKVFLAKGYAKATMDEIALEAEISKPTVYQYFKTKDDLFFSLMVPVIEDIGKQLGSIIDDLDAMKFRSGAALIEAMFEGLFHSYQVAPFTFRTVQLFQQAGLLEQLDEETRLMLHQQGGRNFARGRRIMETAIEQGLIKEIDPHELIDVIWGTLVGIVLLQDIKSQRSGGHEHLKPTLELARQIIIDSVATDGKLGRASRPPSP